MRFLTANGTWYEIKGGHWLRLGSTERSGLTRSDWGTIIGTPFVEPGKPACIEDDNVKAGHDRHFLYTSNVVVIQT